MWLIGRVDVSVEVTQSLLALGIIQPARLCPWDIICAQVQCLIFVRNSLLMKVFLIPLKTVIRSQFCEFVWILH